MKKEIVACDVCGHEMKEGFTLKGSLKHTCDIMEDIGGEDVELHFHDSCLMNRLFAGYAISKKRNGRKTSDESLPKDEGATGDDIFDEVPNGGA